MGVIPWSPLAGGWLSGRFRRGSDVTSHRAARIPARYDLSIPGNQQKLDAVEQLAQLAEQAGISLIHLALAFVHPPPGGDRCDHRPAHPRAARGPARAPSTCSCPADVLDAIDGIVPPGNEPEPGRRRLAAAAPRRPGLAPPLTDP